MVQVETIEVDVAKRGHITNCYLVYDENKKAVLIDPGYDATKIIKHIKDLNLEVCYIVITHAHADHIGALEEIQKHIDAKIIIHKNEIDALLYKVENYSEMLGVETQNIDISNIIEITDEYTFNLEKMEFEIMHAPGHTSGCICLLEKTSNKLFTGDTVFAEGYGRCDLLSSNFESMVNSLRKIFKKFNDDIEIYPGHDRKAKIFTAKRFIKLLLARKGIIL